MSWSNNNAENFATTSILPLLRTLHKPEFNEIKKGDYPFICVLAVKQKPQMNG